MPLIVTVVGKGPKMALKTNPAIMEAIDNGPGLHEMVIRVKTTFEGNRINYPKLPHIIQKIDNITSFKHCKI
jgi:hypothetical protein